MLGGAALITGANRLIDSLSEINDQAQAFGTSAEQLQRLNFFFEQSGASSQETAKGLNVLIQKLEDARQKGGEASKAFEKLGISQEQIDSEGTVAILFRMADALKESDGGTREFAAAADILGGKLSAKLIPGLAQGADEMIRMGKSATVAADETIKAFDDMGDARDRFFQERKSTLANNIFALGEFAKAGAAGGKGFVGKALGGIGGMVAGLLGEDVLSDASTPAVGEKDLRAQRSDIAAARANKNASVAERHAKEMEGFAKSQLAFEKLLGDAQEKRGKEQAEIDSNLLRAAETRRDTELDSLDGYERINELEKDRATLVQQILSAGDKERSQLDIELAQLDDRIAKEKAITAEKNLRSSISEDVKLPKHLAPALTRTDRVGDRARDQEAAEASRRIGNKAVPDAIDEYARSRGEYDKTFGKRGAGGREKFGPWRPGEEPPAARGMGQREKEKGRLEDEIKATISPESIKELKTAIGELLPG